MLKVFYLISIESDGISNMSLNPSADAAVIALCLFFRSLLEAKRTSGISAGMSAIDP
jgi:hypothetical protein